MGFWIMISMFFIASGVAYKVPYDLATKWRWMGWGGWGPIVATILGIVGSYVATVGTAIAVGYLDPEQSMFELYTSARFASKPSLIISPISAFFGWRNSKLSNESSGVVGAIYSEEAPQNGIFRNWVLPIILSLLFMLAGIIIIGLPGFELITTVNGVAVDGNLPKEEISSIVSDKGSIGSYLSFYGVRLFGKPMHWHAGIIITLGIIGYKIRKPSQ